MIVLLACSIRLQASSLTVWGTSVDTLVRTLFALTCSMLNVAVHYHTRISNLFFVCTVRLGFTLTAGMCTMACASLSQIQFQLRIREMLKLDDKVFATCNMTGIKLTLVDWYHKRGEDFDICGKMFRRLPDEERAQYIAVTTLEALGDERSTYDRDIEDSDSDSDIDSDEDSDDSDIGIDSD